MAKNRNRNRSSNETAGTGVNPTQQDQDMSIDNEQGAEGGLPPETTEQQVAGDAGSTEQSSTGQETGAAEQTATGSDAPAVVDQGVKSEAPAPVAAPVAAPAPAPVPQAPAQAAPVVTLRQPEPAKGFDAIIADLKVNGTSEAKKLIAIVEQYMARMQPGQMIDFDQGARNQHQLWQAIRNVVEHAPQEQFRKLWSVLLGYFEAHKDGVFGDRYVFRFSEHWHFGDNDLQAFQRILNVMRLTSNPNDRAKGLRQVDLNRSLESGFTEAGRQRLVQFYQQ